MSVNFRAFEEGQFHLVDPVDGELITSGRVPRFLESHERYGPGIAYLQQHAGSIAISLHLVEHETAGNLGDDFEEKLAAHDTLAIEDNGWSDGIYEAYTALSAGETLDNFVARLDALGYQYEHLKEVIADESTFQGRLVRAVQDSGIDICIADIPDRYSGEYEEHVHWLWRQSRKNDLLPLLREQAIAIREWFMPANLGVHLRQHGRESTKVLQVVGANHFLLQDKYMTLGIMPDTKLVSGDGGLSDPNSPMSRMFAVRNVGHVSMEGLDLHGRPIREQTA